MRRIERILMLKPKLRKLKKWDNEKRYKTKLIAREHRENVHYNNMH
jgi:tetrahydromethanopterin S-methyltransferase subunit F